MGNGKTCERSGTKRAKMNEYMEGLKKKVGYVSLKIRHAEKQAQMFPSLHGLPGGNSSEQEVQNLWSMVEGEVEEDMVMLTPIEERDRLIAKQKEEIESLLKKLDEPTVKNETIENLKTKVKTYEKKLLFARNVTEQKLFENISDPNFFRDEPHLVQVYTATLNEDEILDPREILEEDKDEKSQSPRSRKDKFLSNVSKHFKESDPNHSLQIERLDHIKQQVFEKVKQTQLNKSKPRTATPKRRLSLSLFDNNDRSTSRPRTSSPPLNSPNART